MRERAVFPLSLTCGGLSTLCHYAGSFWWRGREAARTRPQGPLVQPWARALQIADLKALDKILYVLVQVLNYARFTEGRFCYADPAQLRIKHGL